MRRAARDGKGNVSLCKRKSRNRIDPAAATVNGVAALKAIEGLNTVSVYETRGFFTLDGDDGDFD